MPQNLILSFLFHISVILIAIVSFPFIAKKPIDIPPLVSVELIQITDKTNIPFAPKAEKIIEKVKKEKEKLVSVQAPPKKVKKEKPDAIPLPDKEIEKIKKVEKDKQKPKIDDNKAKQVSEFEKKELFDPNNIAALIDKSKENFAETNVKNDEITQRKLVAKHVCCEKTHTLKKITRLHQVANCCRDVKFSSIKAA